MSFNSVVSRSKDQALIPEVVSNDILTRLTNESAAMTLFKKISMSTSQTRMPVLSSLPTAYFVNGDTGLKQTTDVTWSNKFLNVEEMAAIVPIPENVLDDTKYDVWGAIKPLIVEAMARVLDAAVFFGTNIPTSWPTAIAVDAASRSKSVQRGTATQALGGLSGDISSAFATIESDGYDINGIIANRTYRGKLRNVRSTQGVLLSEINEKEAYGTAIMYPMRGIWASGTGAAEMIAGDFTQGILGTRTDISMKVLDQAVIQDSSGNIQYNLAQQDMVALRVTMRMAFQLANVINYDNTNAATRYPFCLVTSP